MIGMAIAIVTTLAGASAGGRAPWVLVISASPSAAASAR
jgi:hypothetical protein